MHYLRWRLFSSLALVSALLPIRPADAFFEGDKQPTHSPTTTAPPRDPPPTLSLSPTLANTSAPSLSVKLGKYPLAIIADLVEFKSYPTPWPY
jgi:hypothetical protein